MQAYRQIAACLVAGIVLAAAIVVWPRPALICLGLVSLLLGLLGFATLTIATLPAVVAIIGRNRADRLRRAGRACKALLREAKLLGGNGASGQPNPDVRDAPPGVDQPRQRTPTEDRVEPTLHRLPSTASVQSATSRHGNEGCGRRARAVAGRAAAAAASASADPDGVGCLVAPAPSTTPRTLWPLLMALLIRRLTANDATCERRSGGSISYAIGAPGRRSSV